MWELDHKEGCLLSRFSPVQLFVTLRTVAWQAPLSIRFSRQEYWNGLPCPPLEDLPDLGSSLGLLCLLNWKEISLSLVAPGSPKEAECQRTDAFEVRYWRRLLRVPWTARRSNQSILKEINIYWKDWCWSWSCNTLTTWFEELTHWKSPWCWERLRSRKEGGDRRWNCWIASSTQWTWVWANLGR